jgi:hypothetical protein
MGEQYGARVDHLEALLGCGPRSARRVIARLRENGMISTRRLLVGERAWVMPTSTGLRAAGLTYDAWVPRVGGLAHVAATNDVRLHIQARAPGSEWVPERQLARERQPGEHLTDGVVILDGRRVAIEVELTVKSQQRVTAILDELNRRYDAVLYYCAPAPHRQLTTHEQSGRWPKLGVRELPDASAGPA